MQHLFHSRVGGCGAIVEWHQGAGGVRGAMARLPRSRQNQADRGAKRNHLSACGGGRELSEAPSQGRGVARRGRMSDFSGIGRSFHPGHQFSSRCPPPQRGVFPGPGRHPGASLAFLEIAPACQPGDYALKLIFTNGPEVHRASVDLKVYRFDSPSDLPITIFGGFWLQPDYQKRYLQGSPAGSAALIKKYYASLRDHKFNALGGSYPLPPAQREAEQPIEDFSAYHDLLKYVLDDLKFRYFQIPKLIIGSPSAVQAMIFPRRRGGSTPSMAITSGVMAGSPGR